MFGLFYMLAIQGTQTFFLITNAFPKFSSICLNPDDFIVLYFKDMISKF